MIIAKFRPFLDFLGVRANSFGHDTHLLALQALETLMSQALARRPRAAKVLLRYGCEIRKYLGSSNLNDALQGVVLSLNCSLLSFFM